MPSFNQTNVVKIPNSSRSIKMNWQNYIQSDLLFSYMYEFTCRTCKDRQHKRVSKNMKSTKDQILQQGLTKRFLCSWATSSSLFWASTVMAVWLVRWRRFTSAQCNSLSSLWMARIRLTRASDCSMDTLRWLTSLARSLRPPDITPDTSYIVPSIVTALHPQHNITNSRVVSKAKSN